MNPTSVSQGGVFSRTLVRWMDLCIAAYQRFLSPYKGFRCAHRVLHGGQSCSQYARSYLQTFGLAGFRRALRWRFGSCRTAMEVLRDVQARRLALAEAKGDDASNQQKSMWVDGLCIPLDCASGGCTPFDAGVGGCEGADCCGAADCGF